MQIENQHQGCESNRQLPQVTDLDMRLTGRSSSGALLMISGFCC
jgi:hypothetical protein